jgi:protein-L-isoaspartate O-methyltransferase
VEREPSETNATTLASYEAGSDLYAQRWQPNDPARLFTFLDVIAGLLPPAARVLEIGTGTGHDADLLEQRGLSVRRTDAARAFVNQLRGRGLTADVLNVITDELRGPWDAIYANAVFLHLNARELMQVLVKTAAAAVPAGMLAFTLKVGDGEGWTTTKLNRQRHFTYWREPALRAVLSTSPWNVESIDQAVGLTDDWLYCICRTDSSAR